MLQQLGSAVESNHSSIQTCQPFPDTCDNRLLQILQKKHEFNIFYRRAGALRTLGPLGFILPMCPEGKLIAYFFLLFSFLS